jgi:hypothetical protein
MRYIVNRDYKSHVGEYRSGQILEISDSEYAAWLTRDMGGYLEPITPPVPIAPPVVAAPEVPVTPPSTPKRQPRRRKEVVHG